MGLLDDSAREEHYQALVDAVDIPRPFSLTGFVAAVARQHGCDIDLKPLSPALGPEVSGSVKRTATGFVIALPVAAESWWLHVPTCHELAHVLCNHLDDRDLTISRIQDTARAHSPIIRGAEQFWGPMFRCDLSKDIEREAEFVASLLVGRIERLAGRGAVTPSVPTGDIVGRFARVLGGRRDRRR